MKLTIRTVLIIIGTILLVDSIVLFTMSRFYFGSIVPFFIGLVFCITATYYQKINEYLTTRPNFKLFWLYPSSK